MNLAEVFATFGGLVDGSRQREEVAARLYDDPSSTDARRLLVYEANVRHARQTILDRNFPHTRAALLRAGGPSLWTEVAGDYFRAHPPRGYRYLECAKAFPGFLTERIDARASDVPRWSAELADLELWQTLTRVDPREDLDPDDGPLRLACTVEIRDYQFAIATWLAGGALPEGAPPARATLVVFFRDREGASRRATIGASEVAVIAALDAGRSLASADRGLEAKLEQALRKLVAAGIVIGKPGHA